MTSKYLYRFGYCTPAQWLANDKHGWDDESSGAFFISAETDREALEWGSAVADSFVKFLFESAGWPDPPSWKEAEFAAWIDQDVGRELQVELPQLKAGEMPHFPSWQLHG